MARQRYDSVCASEMKLLEEYDHHVQEIERLSKENDVRSLCLTCNEQIID